ncbi:hypothetical protein C5F52_18110 [Limnohabitans sp. TS-CS-82]|uniref:hypothetical protein n=1 Tax=Limnohabitans sp. TS-CS-82 TaxID=2094193 RepID=UPI000CF2B1A0|nr:hypothetical protein [Limnohabitans sp. TS-CS-82]PQA81924.1 hypothetical protein C5F52_18110 [Limnohabitans sp. TS-CS-82]
MGAKKYYAIFDSKSQANQPWLEIALIVVDASGQIHNKMAVICGDISALKTYDGSCSALSQYKARIDSEDLFHTTAKAVNTWLLQVNGKYSPTLMAPGLNINMKRCEAIGVDFSCFKNKECLIDSARDFLIPSKIFKSFLKINHEYANAFGNCETDITTAHLLAKVISNCEVGLPDLALINVVNVWLPLFVSVKAKKYSPGVEDRLQKITANSHQENT